jgi:hypothetical protein
MKKILAIFAVAGMSAFGAEITGFIGDAKCGAKHADASEASAKCAATCLKAGSDPVLVTKDGKVYKIAAASKDKAMAHAAKTVTVTGNISGDTLTIDSIK